MSYVVRCGVPVLVWNMMMLRHFGDALSLMESSSKVLDRFVFAQMGCFDSKLRFNVEGVHALLCEHFTTYHTLFLSSMYGNPYLTYSGSYLRFAIFSYRPDSQPVTMATVALLYVFHALSVKIKVWHQISGLITQTIFSFSINLLTVE